VKRSYGRYSIDGDDSSKEGTSTITPLAAGMKKVMGCECHGVVPLISTVVFVVSYAAVYNAITMKARRTVEIKKFSKICTPVRGGPASNNYMAVQGMSWPSRGDLVTS
jgi:hypothetical protein